MRLTGLWRRPTAHFSARAGTEGRLIPSLARQARTSTQICRGSVKRPWPRTIPTLASRLRPCAHDPELTSHVSRLSTLDSRLTTGAIAMAFDTWLAGNVPLGTAVALLVGIVL